MATTLRRNCLLPGDFRFGGMSGDFQFGSLPGDIRFDIINARRHPIWQQLCVAITHCQETSDFVACQETSNLTHCQETSNLTSLMPGDIQFGTIDARRCLIARRLRIWQQLSVALKLRVFVNILIAIEWHCTVFQLCNHLHLWICDAGHQPAQDAHCQILFCSCWRITRSPNWMAATQSK